MNLKLITFAASLGIALGALAQSPSYVSALPNSGTTSAQTFFRAEPGLQTRVVSVYASSTTNNAQLQFTTCTSAHTIMMTNLTTGAAGTNFVVNSTVGLAVGDALIYQDGATNIYTTVWATNAWTNLIITATLGKTVAAGSQFYKLSYTTNSLYVGIGTNIAFNGEAIFVGNRGRPVRVVVSPGLTVAAVQSATARMD